MVMIEAWLRQPAAQAIGWALLQFVWQGAIIGLLAALALAALRRGAADIRYVVSSIALALMCTLPLVTGVQRYEALTSAGAAAVLQNPAPDLPSTSSSQLTPAADRSRSGDEPGAPATAASILAAPLARIRTDALLPVLLLGWLGGVSILTLRLLTGWLWVQRLRTHGTTAAADDCQRIMARLARHLHIARAIALVESSLVEVPTVIGFLKPVVLLPASALAGLTPSQIEAILAHELAHVRRHDYLVNLLQTLVETVLFYHPAVWWLSRRIRIERENCCDDLAVRLCGDPVAYATALVDLETLRSSGAPLRRIAMAATGGSLLQRVRRLLGAPSSHTGRGPAWLAGAFALLLVAAIAAGAERRAAAQAAPARPVVAAEHVGPDTEPAPPDSVTPPTPPAPAVPAVPAAPAVPAVPAAPAAPAAPTIAAAPSPVAEQSVSIRSDASNSSGNWSWSNNGDRLDVSYTGKFEFTDDDTDVRQMSVGGSLKISDGRWLFGRHSVEIREHNGALEHRYYVNASERPFEPEGRAWLRENLPRFVRNTGMGADARVARLLKNGGPAAVSTEIGRIESSYVKGIYFKELFRQAALTPAQYRDALTQAGHEITSSYELAQLLIAVSEKLPSDEASRAAYFQAAGGVKSDYDLRRVFSAMLKRGPVSSAVLGSMLATARHIHSNYDMSELLREILAQQTIDEPNRTVFFAAVASIGSAYDRHRVLSALVSGQAATDPALLDGALASAAGLHSDYEAAQFLIDVLRQNGVEGNVRAPFFNCVNTINSAYDRGRVLQAVVRRSGTSTDTLRAVLQSSRPLSGYELSQVLQLIARTQPLSGDLRDAYLDAASRLGDYEQTQALAALVRSERRR